MHGFGLWEEFGRKFKGTCKLHKEKPSVWPWFEQPSHHFTLCILYDDTRLTKGERISLADTSSENLICASVDWLPQVCVCSWAQVTGVLHATAKEEKQVSCIHQRSQTKAFGLTHKWVFSFAFASSSSSSFTTTYITHTPKYPTEVTAGIRQSSGCLYFFTQRCWHRATWAAALWGSSLLCDQLWLSHWTCPAVKPDPVVRFSLKWKGNTVCLPQAQITVWGLLDSLYYVGVPSKCISATHLSGGNGIWVPDNGVQFETSFWQGS